MCIGDEVGGNFVEAVAHVRGNTVLSSINDAGLQRGVQLRVSDCGGGSAQSIHGADHQVGLGHADLQALHLVQREVGGFAQTLVDLRGDEQAARTFDQPAQSNITAVGIFHALQQLVAQTALSHILKLCHILKDIRQAGGADQLCAVVGQRRSVAAEDIQSTHLDALHGLSLGTQRAVDVQVNGDVTAGQLFDLLSKGVCANGCAVVLAVDLVPCQLVVIAGAALACTCCRRGSGGSCGGSRGGSGRTAACGHAQRCGRNANNLQEVTTRNCFFHKKSPFFLASRVGYVFGAASSCPACSLLQKRFCSFLWQHFSMSCVRGQYFLIFSSVSDIFLSCSIVFDQIVFAV